jgi:hypothetical protein
MKHGGSYSNAGVAWEVRKAGDMASGPAVASGALSAGDCLFSGTIRVLEHF